MENESPTMRKRCATTGDAAVLANLEGEAKQDGRDKRMYGTGRDRVTIREREWAGCVCRHRE